jgi:NAD(P)-dependent dehydrogenase (short-subunit alcohol dehydrogenase family)
MLLENRVVFLTGGAGGIGRECALAYLREGASVVIADLDADQASNRGGSRASYYSRALRLGRRTLSTTRSGCGIGAL